MLRCLLIVALICPALALPGCAGPDKPAPPVPPGDEETTVADARPLETEPPSVEQLWMDFCHYVVIASPDLAAAYGQRLLTDASPEQLRDLLAADDPTTRRAVRLLDETALTANHLDLGAAWRRIRARAGAAPAPDG